MKPEEPTVGIIVIFLEICAMSQFGYDKDLHGDILVKICELFSLRKE